MSSSGTVTHSFDNINMIVTICMLLFFLSFLCVCVCVYVVSGLPWLSCISYTLLCLVLCVLSMYYNLIQAVKKSVALRKAMVKKDVKSKVAAKKWL